MLKRFLAWRAGWALDRSTIMGTALLVSAVVGLFMHRIGDGTAGMMISGGLWMWGMPETQPDHAAVQRLDSLSPVVESLPAQVTEVQKSVSRLSLNVTRRMP